MRRFVLATSLGHLLLLPAYVKIGAVNPWQAVNSLFGGGLLWLVIMLSAVLAPFLLGTLGWVTDAALRRWSKLWVSRLRESVFVIFAIGSLLSLTNAALLADRTIEQGFRAQVAVYISSHLPIAVILTIVVPVGILSVCLASGSIRKRSTRFLRATVYILSPAVLLSAFGIFYVLAMATPLERTKEPLQPSPHFFQVPGSPSSVVVLLFDGFSYDAAFEEGEVDKRLPNMRALADQSLVFHNVRSFSTYTMDNVPPLLTGQIYGDIKLDSQDREVTHTLDDKPIVLQQQRNIFDVSLEQGYYPVVFGYFLRYCSTYVKDAGYCESTSADELNADPFGLVQAFLEVYRLAIAKTLPTSVGYKLETIAGTTFLSLIEDRVLGLQDSVLIQLEAAEGRFLYAHYPVPHIPYIRLDPQTRKLQSSGATYFDSLQAVDFFLGEIQHALQESGVWEDTLLIVLSDHNDAAVTNDVRVPLIIKLPDVKQRIDFGGVWTHAQFLPLLEALFQIRSFDSDTVVAVLEDLR